MTKTLKVASLVLAFGVIASGAGVLGWAHHVARGVTLNSRDPTSRCEAAVREAGAFWALFRALGEREIGNPHGPRFIPEVESDRVLGGKVLRLEHVAIVLPRFGQGDVLAQANVMVIRLIDKSTEPDPARGIGLGAEPDRVGRTGLGIVERHGDSRMPIGAIHGGDIDPANVS
jgi:hypothetical protein